MDALANALSQPNTGYYFMGFIALVFVSSCAHYFPKIWKVEKELKEALAAIPAAERENLPADAYHRRQREEFCLQFERISQDIGQIKSLGHVWDEFVESVVQPKDEGANTIVVSDRPGMYFNIESVLGTNVNLPQFLAYPNYLIGIGLFLTFLGIACALHVAQAGLTSADGGQEAMRHLLGVASTKFLSSLAGIFFSIVLAIWQRFSLKHVKAKITKLCDLIELGTQYKSTAELLIESNEELARHTQALNDMAGNISEGIGTVLSNKLPASVAQALEPLAEEIKGLAQKFSSTNEDALDSVLKEFLGQMRQSTGEDMQGLMESVSSLRTSLDELVGNIRVMSNDFGAETRESSVRLGMALEKFTISFGPVLQGITEFSSTLGSLQGIAGRIDEAGGNLSGAATVSQESMTRLSGTVTEIMSQMEPLKETFAQMSESLNRISATSSQLQQAGSTIFSAAQDFRGSAEMIGQAEERFQDKVKSFESAAVGISGTAEVLHEASNKISTAANPLADVSIGLNGALKQLQETEQQIQQNQAELRQILDGLRSYSETIPQLWQQYETRFHEVDGDLAKAFGELADGSEQFRNSVKEFVSELDEKFTISIEKLSGAIRELTEEREQFSPQAPQGTSVS